MSLMFFVPSTGCNYSSSLFALSYIRLELLALYQLLTVLCISLSLQKLSAIDNRWHNRSRAHKPITCLNVHVAIQTIIKWLFLHFSLISTTFTCSFPCPSFEYLVFLQSIDDFIFVQQNVPINLKGVV